MANVPDGAGDALLRGSTPGSAKIMAAIRGGQPVARSTLRRALQAVGRASGVMLDVESYIVDQRTGRSG